MLPLSFARSRWTFLVYAFSTSSKVITAGYAVKTFLELAAARRMWMTIHEI